MTTTERRLIGGRYELRSRIGAGGMSDVFRAVDQVLGRAVALKLLSQRLASDPAFVERFKREARAAAALNHPNIVAVYDWGVDASTYYMVMELVEGPTLKDLLRERGSLPEREALEIANQVAAALDAAHHQGVVHRDVKPHNVLLTPDRQVKVADFGIARALGEAQVTDATTVFGTAHYVSPEQVQNERVDARSDLYSLGVLLYEMLAGRVPFVADSPMGVAWQHVHTQPEPLRRQRPEISAHTEALTLRLLSKDPGARLQSAAEVRSAIADILAPAPVHAGPDAATQLMTVVPAPPSQRTAPVEVIPAPAPRQAVAPNATTVDVPATRVMPIPAATRRIAPVPASNAARLVATLGLVLLSLAAAGLFLLRPALGGASNQPRTEVLGAQAFSANAAQGTPAAPAATARVQLTETPRPTERPAPASVPPTVVPTQAAAPTAVAKTVPPSSAYVDPAQAVIAFYTAVAEHRFQQAAQLWSEQMQAAYPPDVNIDQRFADTRRIWVTRTVVTQRDDTAGTATVAVELDETVGNPPVVRHWSGTWQLVRAGSGWLLNQPNFQA